MKTLDFETEAITNRPNYPPKPVGLALADPRARYLAYGHPFDNNCGIAVAKYAYKAARMAKDKMLFHHAAFDLEVAERWYGEEIPNPDEWEDTLLLAYLYDPRAKSLSLKPMAEQHLDMPPEEQDALRKWILANVPEAKRAPTKWGAHIAKAPGKLVGQYARGDVIRTKKLYQFFIKDIKERGMYFAYQREKKLIPIKLRMEQRGVKCDLRRLGRDLDIFNSYVPHLDKRIYRRLGARAFNIDSPDQLRHALNKADVMDDWQLTPKGQLSTSMPSIKAGCNDQQLVKLLGLRSTAKTYLNTFLTDWYDRAQQGNGTIHPTFNTVRSTDEYGSKKGVGTRTGRLSSSNPNFQNIPANIEEAKNRDLLLAMAKDLRRYGLKDFVGLRDYLIPRKGYSFIRRDYAQQELRILAHYEDDALLDMYNDNPRIDIHSTLRSSINDLLGLDLPRKAVKTVVFGIIYGFGLDSLAAELGVDKQLAKQIKNALLRLLPGVAELDADLKALAKRGEPMRTWGQREYFCEEPRYIKGRRRTFEYKMLNLLIQGSAADCTKVAMINVDERFAHTNWHLLIQVHDELLAEVPTKEKRQAMRAMRVGMESVNFDLPMLTDGEWGAKSWARLTACA